jgi:myo-inositol-1(or 4)-monophosphatase
VNPDPYRALIVELAERSGDLIRPYFGRADLAVELKADQSPVTAADRGAEALMRDLIHRAFPEHGIIGEELGSERPDAEFVWVLDPIDGTKSFAAAVPLFVTLIALLHRGEPVLGCIHQPILRQLLLGDGQVTTLNGQAVRARGTKRLEEATMLTSDPFNPGKYQDGAAFDRTLRRARLARTWGDGYGYLMVATGWADVMCDPIMNPWDIAALVPVIRGAGGVITDWAGQDPMRGTSIVAAGSAELHAEVIAGLASTMSP